MNQRILVFGGTGFVGRSLCEQLVRRSGGGSSQIDVVSRNPASAKALQVLPTLRLIEADVHDEAQLRRLIPGHDAVVNLVAILNGSEAEFRRAHVELPGKIARACIEAGVRRIVHVSALGASESAPSRYLRSKAAGERALQSESLDVTILRPSVIFGEGDRFMNLFATLQALFPVMPLAGARARFQPVWVQDVASAIVKCLEDRATIGATFECTGPEVYSLQQLVRAAGRWSGHARPVIALPPWLGRLQALAMQCLPGRPLMSSDNLESMKVPSVASGQLPGLEALGIVAATLDSVAPQYLGAGQGIARLNRWRSRHGN